MTVADIVAALSRLPQDAEVCLGLELWEVEYLLPALEVGFDGQVHLHGH